MKSKTKWSIQLGTASLALVLSAVPLSAQVRIAGMQFGFVEADAARDLYNSGRNLYTNNKFAQAEAAFREVVKKYPRNEVADASSYYLILALKQQAKFDEARAQIEVFTKQYPRSVWLVDVRELQVELTRQVPPSYVLALTQTPSPTPSASPSPQGQVASTAPVAIGVRVPSGQGGPQPPQPPQAAQAAVAGSRNGRAPVSPEVS